MLSPNFAKVMLARYRKEQGMATFNNHGLETKYGWGHEAWVKDLADTVEKMDFPPDWTWKDVKNYIAKFIRSCEHSSASSVSHVRDGSMWD